MRVAIIGRSEYLFESAQLLLQMGYEIPLVITSKEAPEYYYKASDFETLAKSCNANYICTPKINFKEITDQIKSLPQIDIAVSINYIGVISQEVIDLFPLGILNAHGGDLPRYRGNACMAWAIINREKKVGLCIHKMIGGELDSGNIIVKKYLNIDVNTRVGQIFNWMRCEIPGMMLQAVELLANNPAFILEEQSKNPVDALRTYPRLPEDGKIDWTKSNEEIVRLINASSEPFGGAFCEFNNMNMTIWRARLYVDDENYLAMPGQISNINNLNGEIIVITGSGKIAIENVGFENRIEPPAMFINSIRKRLK